MARRHSGGVAPRPKSVTAALAHMMPAVQGSTEVDADLADRLGHLFGWYRTRCYDLIASRAGIRIDVSSQLVLAALNWLGPSRTSDVAVALGLDSSTVS